MLIRKEELNSGQSLVEVLVAVGILVLGIGASFFVFFGGQSLTIDSANAQLALDYGSEGLEAVQSIRNRNWQELSDGAHGLVYQNNEWMFGSSTTSDSKSIFTRAVFISTIDQNTKQASTTISWTIEGKTQTVELVEQLTRWEAPLVGGCLAGTLTGNWSLPQLLGSGDLGPGNEGTDVTVKMPYAFVSGTASASNKPDIFVFNVSNPSAPSLIASLNIGADGINALYQKGNYLYGASSNDSKELIIFDISAPAGISEIGSLNISGDHNALSINGAGNTVYLGRKEDGSGNEFFVIDVSTPSSPAVTASFNIGDDVNDIMAAGNRLYLVSEESNNDLWIYDITVQNSPVFLASYNFQQGGELISVLGDLNNNVFVGDGSNDFFSLSAANPSQIYVRDSLAAGGAVNDIICVADNLAFLATSNSGKEFMVVDVNDPANITERASLNFPQVGTGIDFADNKVFMSVRSNDSLRIITSTQ